MHCQKATVKAIIESGNDYCIAVKENQKKLLERIKEHTEKHDSADVSFAFGKSHGRYEMRMAFVYPAFFGAKKEWEKMRSIIVVKRVRRSYEKGGSKEHGYPEKQEETAYFISSLSEKTSAEEFNAGIRSHWAIENCLHYVKDVTFHEDASRIRSGNASGNMSIVRNIALSAFRKHGYGNIAQAIRLSSHDIPLLRGMLGG